MPQGDAKESDVKKVVLAYSGGLDTSIILKWLQTTYGCEVVTFTADLGQGEELEPAREKAVLLGIKPENIFIEDLREEFVRDYVFPMFRANTLYEGQYLLGTSIARPLIAKKQIEIAEKVGADAVAHGATGKGNDQVRFELDLLRAQARRHRDRAVARMGPALAHALIEFAEQHQIPIAKDKRGEAPFSVDANLLHASSEGKVLEDPAQEVPDYVYSRTDDPEQAPDKPTYITVDFERGDAVAIDGKKLSPATLLAELNELGRAHGIGRLDLVENRFVGMKSRGMYETPGGTILLAAHRGIESITLDRGAAHLKDELMPKYAELIYNGFWFAPEREMLQAAIDKSQEFVTGRVRLKLYKGSVAVVGRESAVFALRPGPRHLRGRRGRLRPPRRRRLHPAQRAAAAHARAAQEEAEARPLEGLHRRVAHRLHIVAVGIEHERSVVARMVVRAQPGRAVVCASGRQRGAVEGVDGGAVPGRNCDVQHAVQPSFSAYPEVRLAASAEARCRCLAAVCSAPISRSGCSRAVPAPWCRTPWNVVVGDGKADMIEHDGPPDVAFLWRGRVAPEWQLTYHCREAPSQRRPWHRSFI